jgi:UDP-GlcNAc:undecaprenyl-phosphate GlcNAc-1-phosphate transferase
MISPYLDLWQQLTPDSWLRALTALVITALLIPFSTPLATRLGLVDRPGGRKQHSAATPVHGGLAILAGMLLSSLLFGDYRSPLTLVFYLAGGLLILVGAIDDFRELGWRFRLGAQILAALVIAIVGGAAVQQLSDVFGVSGLYLGWLGIPVTAFVVVGTINALNMADGLDGLAPGQALVSLLLFVCFALYAGDVPMAERLLTVAAAVLGFMVWNLRFPWQPRARVFLGDAGSMLLGFVNAWAAVRLTQNPAHPVSPVLGPWTISLPLIDGVSLIFRRRRHGRSPFAADRDHLHHLLLDAGYGPGAITWGMMAVSALMGLSAAMALKLGVYRPLLVLGFLALIALYHLLTSDRSRAVAFFRRLRLGGRETSNA